MNRRNLMMIAVFLAAVLTWSGEALARGGRGGYGGGPAAQPQFRAKNQPGNCAVTPVGQVRPADSRRRDGTFLQTGTTANGATSRPGYGRGLMDGSAINPATASE